MDNTPWQRAIAEFVATFALIFIGAASVLIASNPLNGSGLVGVALAHGIVLAVMVSVVGHLSGGHVNPAVTIAVWATGELRSTLALVYIASQLAGATLGALALKAVFPAALWESGKGGTPLLAHGMSTGKGVLLEALLTAFLVFVVYGVAVDERGSFAKIAGLPIGLVLTFDILAAGPLTGAAMNPARAFGPALVYGDWTNWWVYWIGPIGGAVVAAAIYWFAFLGGRERLVAMRKSQHPIGGPDDADTAIGVSEGVDIPGE